MAFGTILPVHNAFTSVGSGSAHTSFTSFYDDSDKALDQFASVGSGSAHSAFKLGGYEVVIASVSSIDQPQDDSTDVHDSTTISIAVIIDDSTNIYDSTYLAIEMFVDEETDVIDEPDYDGPKATTDMVDVVDEFMAAVDIFASDSTGIADVMLINVVPDGGFSDSVLLSDSSIIGVEVTASDSTEMADSSLINIDIQNDESLGVRDQPQVRRNFFNSYGIEVQARHSYQNSYGIEVAADHFTAYDGQEITNPANPTNPTIITKGVTIISNPATFKPEQVGNQIGTDLGLGCDLFEVNINASLQGWGSFEIKAQTAKGSLNGLINIGGIPCTVTEQIEYSNSDGKGVRTSGVVGEVGVIDQELMLIADAKDMFYVRGNMPRPLQNITTTQWKTVRSIAEAIAATAGVGLSWNTVDAPLTDLALESGMTIAETIRSLAARVGGILVPQPGIWVVADVARGVGGWSGVPHCSLYGPGGLESGPSLYTRTRSVLFTVSRNALGGAVTIRNPLIGANPPPVRTITSSTSKITSDSPLWEIQLPQDFKYGRLSGGALWFKILVKDDSAQLGLPYTTAESNPDVWTVVTPDVHINKDGIRCAYLDHTYFDSALKDGKFHAHFGYTEDITPPSNAFDSRIAEVGQRQKLLEQSEFERTRYFKIQSWRADLEYCGSLPWPGNRTSFAYDGINASGIVESMSANLYPSYKLSVTGGRWVVVQQTTPRSYLDYFVATQGA
jgi:hypothetical protein